jgi:hypothetical protein
MAGKLTISTLNDSSGVLATQNGMTGIAKAWVYFQGGSNGTTAGTINASFNVSSVTVTSTGLYVINYTTALPSANQAVIVTASPNFGVAIPITVAYDNGGSSPVTSTSAAYISIRNTGAANIQTAEVAVSVFGA